MTNGLAGAWPIGTEKDGGADFAPAEDASDEDFGALRGGGEAG